MVKSSACSSSPSRASVVRSRGPAARSKGRVDSSAARARRAASRSAGGWPERSTTSMRAGRGGSMTCTGSPAVAGEAGAQRLVAADDLRQGALQRLRVQPAAQAQGGGQVVGAAPRLQLVDEPQPLLRERERAAALRRDTGTSGGGAFCTAGPPPCSDWMRRRQRLRRGPVEHGAQGQVHAQRVAHAGHHARGQQRVPAQGEEVVPRAHSAPRSAPPRRCRPAPPPWACAARRALPPGPATPRAAGAGRGEGAAGDLAAGGQRERVQHHHRGGHHVLRQPRLPRARAAPPGRPPRPPPGPRIPPAAGRPARPRGPRRRPRARRRATPARPRPRRARCGSRAP